jgi:YVTN family beta-propeller protein
MPKKPLVSFDVLRKLMLLLLGLGLITPRFSGDAAPQVAGKAMVYLPFIQKSTMTDGLPSWGTPIVLSPSGEQLWVVNPDAGSVTVLNTEPLEKVTEIPVGQEPWALAISPNGEEVYVVNRAGGDVWIVNAGTYEVLASIPVGPEPGAAALTPSGAELYVTVSSSAEVVVILTKTREVFRRIPVAPNPYGIAVTDNGNGDDTDETIYVTHFFAFPLSDAGQPVDDGHEGRVSVLETKTYAVMKPIVLPPDKNGFPNLMSSIALKGEYAWLPYVRAAPALPNGLTTTVFAAVGTLDLKTNAEDPSARLRLNDQEVFGSPVNNPLAALPSPDGNTLYIVLAGSDLVEVIDISNLHAPHLVKFIPAGKNPRGMTIRPDGKRGYVMSYLSRTVTVINLETNTFLTEIPVTAETLLPEGLEGKILFNNATDPRLSQGSWMSCASCHPEGGTDGITWMFPDGPRQSPPLWNAPQTLPWHWSAALDEPQDVEETLQIIQHGLGLAPGADPAQLGFPNAGRSVSLDALALFLAQGIRNPTPPVPPGNLSVGRALYIAAGCPACHGGANWTSSALPGLPGTLDPDGNGMVDEVLRKVGTLNPLDVRGATGFDPPSLLNVGLTAPYLHDGSVLTLELLLATGHPDPLGAGNGLSPAQIESLTAFLHNIGPATPPIHNLEP